MRVLHVAHYWERVGGAEVHMHSLAEELERRGHECAFFAGSTETELDTPRACVVKRSYFPHANMLRDAALCRELLRFARAFQPDLIHVHKLVAFPVEIVLALRACRVPLINSI
jgi:glycosyltransferase involved in cell wall biosynthesis